jgi:hypothetical protein
VYFLNIGHQFPPDDMGTSPPVSFTNKITRFFNTHPRNYKTTLYPAPSRGKYFRDDFNGDNVLPLYPRWRVYSADTTGRLGEVRGARFKITDGRLVNEPSSVVKSSGFSDRIAVYAFTDFMQKPLKWETSFSIERGGKELRIYPCIFRDMQGRIVFLSVGEDEWEWGWAEEHLAFHSEFVPRIHTLQKGRYTFQGNKEYKFKIDYYSATPEWQISTDGESSLVKGTLPSSVPYLDEIEAGVGVKGLPSQVASFDYVLIDELSPVNE